MEEAICIQVNFTFQINLQMNIFLAKCDHFFSRYCVVFKPCQDGYVQLYGKAQELKKKAFNAKRENIKQTTGIQVTFIFIIKLQKYFFQQNMTIFSSANMFFLNPCQDGNAHSYAHQNWKKKAFTINNQNKNLESGISVSFIIGKRFQNKDL